MTGRGERTTLGAKLRTARASAFVGRSAELARFRQVLAGEAPAILWVFAAGGTGKTTLLRECAELARAAGAAGVEIDFQSVEAAPAAISRELEPLLSARERAVVFLDSYERAIAIDGWLRETLIPALPADAILVIGARNAPASEWRSDPGLTSILQTIELESFDRDASLALLASRGIDRARAGALVTLSHGHALALVLLAEVLRGRDLPPPSSLRDLPSVLSALVGRLVREIRSEAERRALEVAAHARTTTEQLLRDLFGAEPAHELLAWLRALPFATAHKDGVRLHPIVRDAVDEDFRWRDPGGYRELHLAIADHLLSRVMDAGEIDRERAYLDLFYLRRVSPPARRYIDFDTLGSGWAETPRADEQEVVASLIEAEEGPAAGRVARYWFASRRESFTVVRSPLGDPVVVSLHLALRELPAEVRALDPAMEAIQRFLERRGGLRPEEHIAVSRFAVGRDPSADGRLRHFRPMLLWLTTPRLAFAFTALANGRRWEPALAEVGHLKGLEIELGGRTMPIFVGDYRERSPSDWLRAVLTRDLESAPPPIGGSVAASATATLSGTAGAESGLDRETLGAALREALENLTRSDRLARSALLRARCVRRRAGGEEPSAKLLRRMIEEAVGALREDPRDAKLARALDAAFVHPAPSREAAAERIDVPFSSFRRHLAKGVERLAEIFWTMERE